ncbi:sulfatase-like hydrolase/transferase [Salinarchaeum sp. Harcht-Bsk1]|uniref:sulfatase-like hydrolase/transferase n=1 Tax=Salinarchaeum sp. Harcht-Bsk1 TaxID=1333523 RepID=UPI000677C9B1|nr:sulfatase-like hydrolase/transferase [Salinarchaeum sp. Harcht-Bsk1]
MSNGGSEDPPAERPNVLFVCVDCLRSDFVGTDHADTPFIDSLVERGASYPSTFATATTTTPAVASFMTGRYSEGNGIHSLDEGRLREDVDTLAERFSEAGYETTAMVTGPLVEDTGLDRGFDEYHYRDRTEKLTEEWEAEAADAIESLAESDADDPFFCYLHLWAIHKPIEVPPDFDDPQYGETPYARTLSALDRSLERVCDRLPDDTVIALHGDHGEAITWIHNPVHKLGKYARTGLRYYLGLDTRPIERRIDRFVAERWPRSVPDRFLDDRHGENVADPVANVPFVLSGPGIPEAEVDAQVRQVDVFPTLLDLLDGDDRSATEEGTESIDGESLLSPERVTDRDAYMRACGASLLKRESWARGLRADGKKLVVYPDRDWSPEFYDLEEDPLELYPIDDEDAIEQYRARFPDRELTEGERLEIDGLLEDLGYK